MFLYFPFLYTVLFIFAVFYEQFLSFSYTCLLKRVEFVYELRTDLEFNGRSLNFCMIGVKT